MELEEAEAEVGVGTTTGLIVNLLVVTTHKRENPALNVVASRRDKRGDSACGWRSSKHRRDVFSDKFVL